MSRREIGPETTESPAIERVIAELRTPVAVRAEWRAGLARNLATLSLGAAEAPRIEMAHIETPSPFTPVGAKGCGESSAETAPAAVANAVADALRPLGLKPSHLPLTPARLWELSRT